MRTFRCLCGNRLYFENTSCLACGRMVRFCPGCRAVTAMGAADGPLEMRCGFSSCGSRLWRCVNDAEHDVCNRAVLIGPGDETRQGWRCDCCVANETIPDLTVPGNHRKWYRLEAAKRRLYYELEGLGLPIGEAAGLPLRFDFKADVIPERGRSMGSAERVFTGHADGKITINIREAEDVERERLRVELDEAHRTLIGHFRHEIAHYYWQAVVQGRDEREASFAASFGDPWSPAYAEALERHYREGPPEGWRASFVSAYASVHPWEDFAETFALYLDMVASLDTARHLGFIPPAGGAEESLDEMVARFGELGLAMNEMNRTMGLIDLVPELLVPPVIEKLRSVHGLLRAVRTDHDGVRDARAEEQR